MASSDNFQFDFTFLVFAAIISSICILYILLDFCINQKSREIPTRLMVARSIFDYVAVLVVLIVLNLHPEAIRTPDSAECQFQGAVFLFSLYMATAYYALICWELVWTLQDPFRKPSSGSVLFHAGAVLVSFVVVLSIALSNKFAFRQEFEICFIKAMASSVQYNLMNWFLIYIPLFIICIGGFIAAAWIFKRLRSGINRDTYELRLVALKQQNAIILLFTFNYIFQGICWIILFRNAMQNIDEKGPYLLSSFCLIASIFDAIAWIVRKYIKELPSAISSSFSPKTYGTDKVTSIAAALRKEVITCIIDGISRSDRKVSELEEMNNKSGSINNNNNYSEVLIPQNLKGDNETLLQLSEYYPANLNDKIRTNVIEEYPIDPIHSNTVQAVFRNYAPRVFAHLRSVYGVTDELYYNSILPTNYDVSKLSLELCANFSEGRSGAFLFFTKDKKYLIKTLTKSEAQLLVDTLKQYVAYMTNYRQKTYLLKYYGLHAIKLYGHSIYFVVNKNIFSDINKAPDEKYDLKGSWIDRNTNHGIEEKKLMKDKDLKKPLMINRMISAGVYQQLQKDVDFLADLNIMDYSLLLGIYYKKVPNNDHMHDMAGSIDDIKYDEKNENENDMKNNNNSILNAEVVEGAGKYCIGIIDMLQKWDLNKRTERTIKAYFRCKDKNGISCVPPKQYSNRFLDKMQEIGIGYDGDHLSRISGN